MYESIKIKIIDFKDNSMEFESSGNHIVQVDRRIYNKQWLYENFKWGFFFVSKQTNMRGMGQAGSKSQVEAFGRGSNPRDS